MITGISWAPTLHWTWRYWGAAIRPVWLEQRFLEEQNFLSFVLLWKSSLRPEHGSPQFLGSLDPFFSLEGRTENGGDWEPRAPSLLPIPPLFQGEPYTASLWGGWANFLWGKPFKSIVQAVISNLGLQGLLELSLVFLCLAQCRDLSWAKGKLIMIPWLS